MSRFDFKAILAEPEEFLTSMAKRNFPVDLSEIAATLQTRNERIHRADEGRAERKRLTDVLMRANRECDNATIDATKARLVEQKEELAAAEALALEEIHFPYYPNILDERVPHGCDETSNEVIKVSVGASLRNNPLAHWDLDVDFGVSEAAAMSGSRFSFLQGSLARLHRVVGQFLIDSAATHGYRECVPPTIVRREALEGTGQLPKFADDLYELSNGQFLIPTGEVPLTNFFANTIPEDRANRLCALTNCYRSEAGSAGRDTRGLIRQHEFQKVELVTVCHPDESEAEFESMIEAATAPLYALGLPHRIVRLCGGDTGASSSLTHDIEVWMAGQGQYREISSVSNCREYQSRPLNIRYKTGKVRNFAHTLNGSALAVGRTVAAILEYYQRDDGGIDIPLVLQDRMGAEVIR